MHTVKSNHRHIALSNEEFKVYAKIRNAEELNQRSLQIATRLVSIGVIRKSKKGFRLMNEDIINRNINPGTFDFVGGWVDKNGVSIIRDIDGFKIVHGTNKNIDAEIIVSTKNDIVGIVGVHPEYSITSADVLNRLLTVLLKKYPNIKVSRSLQIPVIRWLKSEGVIK